ncbi:MAG: sigma-70 family RNA polymerase sigma factor [Bacteroidota bacterium]
MNANNLLVRIKGMLHMGYYNPFVEGDFRARVKAYVFKHGKGRIEPGEILQDGCLRYLIAAHDGKLKGKDEKKCNAFAYGICRNILRDQFKKQGIHTDLPEDTLDALVPHSSDNPTDGLLLLLKKSRNEWLHKKLEESGANCKEILLAKAEGEGAPAIAKKLNLTIKTVHARTNQCRKKLLKLLFKPLGPACEKLLLIFNPRDQELWYDPEFLARHKVDILILGYEDVESAREAALSCMKRLRDFLFPKMD